MLVSEAMWKFYIFLRFYLFKALQSICFTGGICGYRCEHSERIQSDCDRFLGDICEEPPLRSGWVPINGTSFPIVLIYKTYI